MTLRLTIAIPTYNRSALLRRALESALEQRSKRIEILVSDNGSTDDTPSVIARYKDPRLRAIRRDVTVSRAHHGTLLFAAVNTELILVLSDDDYIDPEFSTEVLKMYDAYPEVSFVYTGCIEHYDDQGLPALVGPSIESSLDFIAAHFAGHRHVSWCACVTRVADLRGLGPQPEDRICGDMFFWSRIAFQGPVGCVPRPLAHYTALLPGGNNDSRTTPIIAWGRDISRTANEVKIRVLRTDATDHYRTTLAAATGRYVTRSIANQFIWARILGMNRLACLRLVRAALRFEGWHAQALTRLAVSLALSRTMLRWFVVRGAARMAKARLSMSRDSFGRDHSP